MTNKLLLAGPLILLIYSGCASSHLNASRVNEESFPPEFGDPKYVLLVQEYKDGSNPITNYLKKSFRKNYSGKFETASQVEISNDSKYHDKNLYRFGVVWNITFTTRRVLVNNNYTTREIPTFDFLLHDRLHDKQYPSLGVYSNVPAKAINRTSVLLNGRLKK